MDLGNIGALIFSGIAAIAGTLSIWFLRMILSRIDRVEAKLEGDNGHGLITRVTLLEDRINFYRPYRRTDPEYKGEDR